MTRLMQKGLASTALVAAVLAAASVTTRPAVADNLVVRDFVMTREISGREPVDTVRTYGPQDGDAFAFARIDNSGAPTTVTFKWHYGGNDYAEVQMPVGTSPGWRTWSSANLRPGAWRVELIDANGVVLMEERFRVSRKPIAQASIAIDPIRGDSRPSSMPRNKRTSRSDLQNFPYR